MNKQETAQPKESERSLRSPNRDEPVLQKLAGGRSHHLGGETVRLDASINRLAVQRSSTGQSDPATAPPIVHEVLGSPGQALDESSRAFMEQRFGHDFSRVRVHTDEPAAVSAHAVNALAYTVGRDIVFGAGQYSPHSSEGRKVLAHELAHTIQQGSEVRRVPDQLETTDPGDRAEREADAAAEAVAEGRAFSPSEGNDIQIARQGPEAVPAEETMPETVPEGKDTPKKSVTVNVTYLKDGNTDIATHLAKANTVFAQADVQVKKGKEVTLDETKSKAILGADLILDEYSDPASPTAEETALIKENRTAGTITMYYVKGMSHGSLGEAFWPATKQAASFIYASTTSRTWPHELGHVLLDSGDHPSDADNFMAQTSVASGKELMTDAQKTTIKASSFVK